MSLGLTTYYFLRNDEVINFNTKEIYANVGDSISLEDLGYGVTKQHHKTTYNYNAGGDQVTSVIEYDDSKGFYVAKAGGDVELIITTSNAKFAEFKINIHIGNGSEAHPYYISNQADLELIGDIYALNAHYSLKNDVTVSSTFAPIGKSKETGLWTGFAGRFNGNGYSINGITMIDGEYENAGLFSTITDSAKVTDLVIKNATINGNYTNAGALAGEIAGEVARVQVKNVDITNLRDGSSTGAIAGRLSANASLTVSGADNVAININKEAAEGEEVTAINAVAGGLVGIVDAAKVQATYANTTINVYNATGIIGGLVGQLILGTNVGTIAESYSISSSNYADFGAFIGTISKGDTFNAEVAKKLGYINGNYVVTGAYPVVKNDASNLFTTYYDATNSIYFIVDFADVKAMMANTEYIFFALSQDEKVAWDNLAWNIKTGSLPILRMTTSNLSSVTQEYLTRDLSKETIGDVSKDTQSNAQIFLNYINSCREADGAIKSKKYTLATDVDLTGYDYTTIDLIDSVFDGNGKTITVNLANPTNNNLGLFGKVQNSTIKNLTIKVIGLADATNVGALAGMITTTGEIGALVSNVTIEFPADPIAITATNFGGVAGMIEKSVIIDGATVVNLTMDANANVANAAGLVADNNATIKNSIAENISLYAKERVAGAVATNNGTIDNVNITGTVTYGYNGTGLVAGLAALNNTTVSNSTFNGVINVTLANGTMYVGGASAQNNGTITDVTLAGDGISIANTISNTFYIGGVAALNNATITGAIVDFTNVGTYIQGKLHYVGGIAATNSAAASKITNSVVTSNISGNYVAGIVADMNNGGAKVDQVFVGKSLTEQNIITGDKMVAGLVYNFLSGEMTNVQAVSEIKGQTTDTLSSLIVLEFPAHATIINATINSSLNGNGTFYLDTWCDKTNEGNGANYNVFETIGCSGVMKSITINNDAANKFGKDIRHSEFTTRGALFFYQIPTYDVVVDGVRNTNFYKLVSDSEFNSTTVFKTDCEFSREGTGVLMLFTSEYKYAMEYDFLNSIWSDNDDNTGIKLAFLKDTRMAEVVA